MSWSTAASSCRAAERSCWPTPKYAAPTSAPDGAEALSQEHHQDRDSPTPKPGSYQTVGAPAPGAKVFWLDSPFAPRAVLLHPNRVRTGGGAPTSKPELSPHRRSTRPGCEGALARLPFAPRAVLLHLDRDSPASKPGFFSNRRSTRPGCEGVLA